MRIKTIEVNNYKAFYGKYKINVGGKNLFIYGENGSGKSSLYYALKDFFQSSIENIDLNRVENIFIKDNNKGKCYIKISFSIKNTFGIRKQSTKEFEFATTSKNTDSSEDTSIRDANKLKSFLTYKHLLDIHHLKKGQQIDLFNLLIKGVLRHFKYTLTEAKELGQLWDEVETIIAKETGHNYRIDQKKKELSTALKTFNDAFGELFKEDSPEYILKHAKPILDQFNHKVDLKLFYRQAKPDSDYQHIENNHVHLELMYAGRKVDKPHLFLNEARLSAIAISIYLGMIKRHPQLIPCKILFLDDIFIGLDIANRLPLLKILEAEFDEYQIFITTYDRPWYEYAKSFLEGAKGWLTLEFYVEETKEGYEIPKILDNQELIIKAEWHYKNSDYKAAAVYTRSAFEKTLKSYCQKKAKKIKFKLREKDYASQDFWEAAKEDKDIRAETITNIEQYRNLVLNPFSHYNTEAHEIKTELKDAIEAVKNLQKELNDLCKKSSGTV